MKYGNYYVTSIPDIAIERQDANGHTQYCKGYYCEVFDDPAYGNRVDDFCLAIGHEIADDSNEALDRGIREYLGLNQVMSEQRKNELLGNFIGWFLDHQTSDEGLFRDLHVEIGMTKDELHDFSIDSLDELFDRAEKEHQKEIEETADTITAEDLVEQAVYAANAPDFLSEEEQAEDMLGMLGANIMDEGLQTVDSQSLIASVVADLVIKQSIEDQTEGRYTLTADTLHKLSNGKMMAPTVIEDLLLDRKEIELIEGNWETDELYLYLSSDYVRMEDESDLRSLSQEEVEAMCADHVLWLNDAGGKQADFSNCVIRGMDLSLKNLMNANFNGAKLAEVNLYRTELNFSDCEGAKFYNCHAEGVYSEEVNFKDAVFRNSQLFGGTFTHSNFSNAQFNACDLCYASLQNCCLDGTDFGDSICDQMSRRGCSYDEEAWTAHALSPNLKL